MSPTSWSATCYWCDAVELDGVSETPIINETGIVLRTVEFGTKRSFWHPNQRSIPCELAWNPHQFKNQLPNPVILVGKLRYVITPSRLGCSFFLLKKEDADWHPQIGSTRLGSADCSLWIFICFLSGRYRQLLIFKGTRSTKLVIFPTLSIFICCWIMGAGESACVEWPVVGHGKGYVYGTVTPTRTLMSIKA